MGVGGVACYINSRLTSQLICLNLDSRASLGYFACWILGQSIIRCQRMNLLFARACANSTEKHYEVGDNVD
jgi:hypothetical protein